MKPEITIAAERPDQPDVVALLDALDRYLAGLYEPEANHILGVPELLRPEVSFLVAREAGRPVGCGAVRRMAAEPDSGLPRYGEVKRMMVDPRARGLGVGRRLLDALEARLRRDGYAVAALETGKDQAEAVRLYERAGYRRRGVFGGYPDNGLSVFYAKAL